MAVNLSTARRTRCTAESKPGRGRIVLVAGAGLVALGLLSACSSPSNAPAAGGSSMTMPMSSMSSTMMPGSAGSSPAGMPQSAAMIHISAYKYSVPASVSPGATVSVMNMDGENHTVTADNGHAFDVKATAGSTVTFTAPSTPGSYSFHCTYHANMHGVLVVK